MKNEIKLKTFEETIKEQVSKKDVLEWVERIKKSMFCERKEVKNIYIITAALKLIEDIMKNKNLTHISRIKILEIKPEDKFTLDEYENLFRNNITVTSLRTVLEMQYKYPRLKKW